MKRKIGLPLLFGAVFVATRWPGWMPPNFSAAYAFAFCAGVFLPGWLGWILPLGTLFCSDVGLNLFYYHVTALNLAMAGNYLAFAALIGLGRLYSKKSAWLNLVAGGLLASVIFYLLTNTCAWLEIPEYSKTLAGWIQALTVGTPHWPMTWEFFRNTLLSGGLFTGLFAGAVKGWEVLEPEEGSEPAQEAADETPLEAGEEA